MKNIYIALFALFAGVTINAQVGIKNDVEDPTVSSNTTGYTYPATSATLDTYFSKRGVLVPEYDLKVLDDSTTPVDFTADKAAGKVVDGTMIFNNGNSNAYPRGYYIWVTDRWVYILNKSSVPVQMTLSVLGDNIIIPATAGTNVNYVSKLDLRGNNIDGAVLGTDTSSITLPAGKYAYTYSLDGVSIAEGSGMYFSNFDTNAIVTYLEDSNGNLITEKQYSNLLTTKLEKAFTNYQGLFILDLKAPTTFRQVFSNTDGATYQKGTKARSEFNIIISKY